jgi:sulfide:quinone oxidoreductase
MSARVLIAGGGIGALAAALALREYAPPGVELTLLAPGPDLVLAPETVVEATGGPPAGRYSLAAIVDDLGAELVPDVLEAVDAEQRRAGTRENGLLGYDALLVAVGARPGAGIPGALRFAGARDAAALRAALDSLGPRPRVLFTTGAGVGWTLPLYELALLTAARYPDASVVVATPEPRPAAVFGAVAGREVSRRLAEAGVDVHTGVLPESAEGGALWLAEGGSLDADLVVALPQPAGLAMAGLPADPTGSCPSIATATSRAPPASGRRATRPRARSSRAASPRSRPTSPRARSRRSWAAMSRPCRTSPRCAACC